MILSEKHKTFLNRNRPILTEIFSARIKELTDEALLTPRGAERDAKVDLIQEFKMWIRDIDGLGKPAEKPEPVI